MSDENIYAGSCFCGESALRGCRSARCNGLLSLRVVPPLVGRAGQRVYVMEASGAASHGARSCERWYLQQDGHQLSQVV